MKARIKATEEIKEIESIERFFCTPDGKSYRPHEIEMIDFVDWEQRKFELVKAVLQGMWANERWNDTPYFEIAEIAIEQADTVLAEYRKGGNQ